MIDTNRVLEAERKEEKMTRWMDLETMEEKWGAKMAGRRASG